MDKKQRKMDFEREDKSKKTKQEEKKQFKTGLLWEQKSPKTSKHAGK